MESLELSETLNVFLSSPTCGPNRSSLGSQGQLTAEMGQRQFNQFLFWRTFFSLYKYLTERVKWTHSEVGDNIQQ